MRRRARLLHAAMPILLVGAAAAASPRAPSLRSIEADSRLPRTSDAVLFIPGIDAAPSEMRALAERLPSGRARLYALEWDGLRRRLSDNARDLATIIAALGRAAPDRRLTLIAHSAGGILALRALDELAQNRPLALGRFRRVRLIALDSPWHGYAGPADRGAERFLVTLASAFIPPGLDELRARSALFAGDPSSPDPAVRAGLFGVRLPDSVEIELFFAERGRLVSDWTEPPLSDLPRLLLAHYRHDEPIRAGVRTMNFWRAALSSINYSRFAAEMRELAEAGTLDEEKLRAGLLKAFRRFPGDHASVLRERGDSSFAEWLVRELGGDQRVNTTAP